MARTKFDWRKFGVVAGIIALLAWGQLPEPAQAQQTSCRATTAAPTYANNTLEPLSCDLSGNLRGTVTTVPSGTQHVDGNVANGVADSGNPVKIGAVADTTLAPVTNGQRVDLKADLRGNLRAQMIGISQAATDAMTNTTGFVVQADGIAARSLSVYPSLYNGTTWDRQRSDANVTGAALSVNVPTASGTAALFPVNSASLESNHVLKGSAGNLYGVYVTITTVSGYLMVFNAIAAPADGAVTPVECIPVASNGTNGSGFIDLSKMPEAYATGITAVFSSTGCFTKTASATAFIHGMIK